ncbi:MAG: AAA family ATPase [Candidatus Brockarchaeota archaeon]|nr:AAA family ATPase [Candidatus Brockarchaeota archaeon]
MGYRVFKENGLEKLSADYLPSRLPHREKHEEELVKLLAPAILSRGTVTKNVLIAGASGAGKTATARKVAMRLRKIAEENGVKLMHAHINCRYASSNFGLAQMLIGRIVPDARARGYGASELLQAAYSYLDGRSEFLLLVLDDFDQFVKKCGPGILYELMRLPDSSPGKRNRVAMLIIGAEDVSKYLLESWTRSAVTKLPYDFSAYDYREMSDILVERAGESFRDGAIQFEVVLLISRIVERFGFGSARYGIELLQASGLEAEYDGADRVSPECVRRAQSRIEKIVDLRDLSALSSGHVEAIRAIAQVLGESDEAYVPMPKILGRVDKSKRGQVEKLGCFKRLEFEGLVDILDGKVGLVGTTLVAVENWLARLPEE